LVEIDIFAYSRGVKSCITARPNAYNQIQPRATAACVNLSGLDNSLATLKDWQCPLKNVMLGCGATGSGFSEYQEEGTGVVKRERKLQTMSCNIFLGFWPAGHTV